MKQLTVTLTLMLALAGAAMAAPLERNDFQAIRDARSSLEITRSYRECLAGIADRLEITAKEAYWNREYPKAAEFYRLLLTADRCSFDDLYNLACCYGQMGNGRLAAKYLAMAIKAGFNDLGHLNTDGDFDKVRGAAEFKTLIDRLAPPAQEAPARAGTSEPSTDPVELAVRRSPR